MDITRFTVDPFEDNEYPYRVLVYPNITYQKDLTRDSYIIVIQNALRHLTQVRPDVYWTLILPYHVPSLELPNVEQRILPMPSYPNTMRTHFDASAFLDLINWKEEDYDIVYSHLPEHTAQLANVMGNSTNLSPKFVGYCHWFEVPENTAYAKTMLWSNIAGLLEMDECGVNSKWLKSFILDKFSKMVSPDTLSALDKIIQPHYLGIDESDIRPNRGYEEKRVIFNHRDNDYTGWNWFTKAMDDLWEKRQDFLVYTTLTQIDRPWNKRVNCNTRSQYLDFLNEKPQFGVGCFEDYSAWSISTTDGMSQGVPYILPAGLCYPEMVSKDYPMLYQSKENFVQEFERCLDNPGRTSATSVIDLPQMVSDMVWGNRIDNWFGGWDNVFDMSRFELKSHSEGYGRILDFIEKRKNVSKKDIVKHMNWGVGIAWTPYRQRLRTESHIRFTKNRYEVR